MKHTCFSLLSANRTDLLSISAPVRCLAVAALLGLSVLDEANAQATQISAGRAFLAEQKAEALVKATEQFNAALDQAPANAEANLLRAATLLATEFSSAEFRAAVEDPGIEILDQSPYSFAYKLPSEVKGIPLPKSGARTSVQLGYLVSKKSLVDQILGHLDKITDPAFSTQLTAAETSLLDVRIDYADVCFLRAFVLGAKAAITMSEAYDLNESYLDIAGILLNRTQTLQEVFLAQPRWGTFSGNPAARIAARDLLLRAHAEWEKGFAALKTRPSGIKGHFADGRAASSGIPIPGENQPPPNPPTPSPFSVASTLPASPNLFAIGDLENAETVATVLKNLADSLKSGTIFDIPPSEAGIADAPDAFLRSPRLRPSIIFTSTLPPRSYLPGRFDRGFFAADAWPDPTFGGFLDAAGQYSANLLGNVLIQSTVVEPYDFRILAGSPRRSGYIASDGASPLFGEIKGIAVDKDGNLFIADEGNHVIRKITPDNRIYTVAGQPWQTSRQRRKLEEKYGSNIDPQRYPAIFNWNLGPLAAGPDGSVYFVNGYRISKLSPSGSLSDLAGSYERSRSPIDGTGAQASFDYIQAITVDAVGNVYVCDNSAIRKITPAGVVTTLAGKLRVGDDWDTDGYVDGPGNQARFSYPEGLAVDSKGNVFVADEYNHVIRKIQPDGTTSTFIGLRGFSSQFDAQGSKAGLGEPTGLTIDVQGNLYFADGPLIRKVYPDGSVRTIGGNRFASGLSEGVGEQARLGGKSLQGIAVDRRGTLYIAYPRVIFEADSVVNPPSAPPFATPTLLPTPKPTPVANSESVQLLNFNLESGPFDLRTGPALVPFNVLAIGKIKSISLLFENNLNQKKSFSISPWEPSFHVYNYLYLNQWENPAKWNLIDLTFSDANNFTKSFNKSQLVDYFGREFSYTIDETLRDTTPPILHKLEFLDTQANTSNSSAKIRYRFEVSDDLSGFASLSLNLRPASGWSWSYSHYSPSIVSVNGNRTTYEGTIEIPQGSQVGDWVIGSISWQDRAGNSLNYASWNNPIPADLVALKITTGPNFTNPPAPEDKYHPWVVGFEIEPEAVDVSSADQKVTIRVRVNNDNLPTSKSISADLRKLDQDNNWRDELEIDDFRLDSGTVANGVYEAELVVPKNYKSGNYTLDSLSVYESGNYNGPSKRWSRYGSNIPAEFRKSLRVSGTADRTAPELKGLTLSNATLDTRSGTATFSATLQITDDMVGLMGDSNGWEEGGAIGFTSPSGVGYAWSEIHRANRISGTSSNGTYQVWFQLPQYSEEGTWTLDYIELRDRNFNTRFLIPANLVAMEIPVPTFEVQGHPRGWEQQTLSSATTAKANATISLGDLVQTANGTGKTPSVSIAPGILSQNVTLTYNGTTTAPTAPGTYTVVAYLNHSAYQGRTVSTMTINSPPPPVVATTSSGGAPVQAVGGGGQVQKPKNGGSKNKSSGSAKKAGGSTKKSAVSKPAGSKKSGGKKKKK